jgi:hypothetical protein
VQRKVTGGSHALLRAGIFYYWADCRSLGAIWNSCDRGPNCVVFIFDRSCISSNTFSVGTTLAGAIAAALYRRRIELFKNTALCQGFIGDKRDLVVTLIGIPTTFDFDRAPIVKQKELL